MPKDLNFAVVGMGMGGHHAIAIQNAKGANLYAVCDVDEKRLKDSGKKYGCAMVKDFRDLLKDPAVDVVCIVTETGYHTQLGIQAARAGKHIVMEKPIDVTPAKIRKFEEVVAKEGVKCACVFQARVEPCNVKIKKAIEAGKMGRIIGLHGAMPWNRDKAYFSGPHGSWHGTWKLDGGGSLMNQGLHTLDAMIFFGGRVKRVAAFFDSFVHGVESEDHTAAVLEFESGALGTLFTTTAAYPEQGRYVYGMGSKGSFKYTGTTLELYEMGGKKERERMMATYGPTAGGDDAGAKDPMAVATDGHRLLMEDLVKAVRKDCDPVIPIAEAKHAVEVVYAAYKSARTGRVITVNAQV